MTKFKNKFRIESARLQSWDYGSNGAYFVTICTKNRNHFFGEIINGEMQLNEIGQLAEKNWMEITIHFPFIELGNFVVMPNHVHGILIIDKNYEETERSAERQNAPNAAGGITGINNPMFHENISRIIRWFKGRWTFESRIINPDFGCQTRFHDHIIRNSNSFENIQNYIANNPMNWAKDKFHEINVEN